MNKTSKSQNLSPTERNTSSTGSTSQPAASTNVPQRNPCTARASNDSTTSSTADSETPHPDVHEPTTAATDHALESIPYPTFYILNVEGLSPQAKSESKWKITFLSGSLLNAPNSSVPFLAVRETWLKSYITDAQLKIPNYTVYCSDRSSRIRGGALLYIRDTLVVSNVKTFDDNTCESVICTIDSMNSIVVSIYKPPTAPFSSFSKVMSHMQDYLDASNNDQKSIYVTGDFNFPNMNWGKLSFRQTLGTNNNQACELLLNFMGKNSWTKLLIRIPETKIL